MKKIIFLFTAVLAFSVNATAQSEKKATSKTEAKAVVGNETKDIEELATLVNLSPELKKDFLTLVEMRKNDLANTTNPEEKKGIFQRYTDKMIAGLTPEQKEILANNPTLAKRLTTYSGN